MLETTREREGYDGTRNGVRWWFEAWGSGPKGAWTTRGQAGRPPTPQELARSDYVVFGIDKGGSVSYKTRVGGLDLDFISGARRPSVAERFLRPKGDNK